MNEIAPALYSKWLEAKNPRLDGLDVKLFNQCMVFAETHPDRGSAFAVFEPRNLDAALIERLEARRARDENARTKFVIFVPAFLKFRAETVVGNRQFEIRTTSFLHLRKVNGSISLRSRLRVISVDDSPVILKFLKHCMDQCGFIDVVDQISDPQRAKDVICKASPDLVTMDIQMPGKTGVEVVREIMSITYLPILMISSVTLEEGSLVFSALNAGAFDYIQKPKLEEAKAFQDELLSKISAAVQARPGRIAVRTPKTTSTASARPENYDSNLLWCLGASTGGTQALTQFFTSLPTHIPPTLVVQHIPPVFSRAFAESLNQLVPFTVKEAEDGEAVLPDHAYIAPGGIHMGVERRSGQLHIVLKDEPAVNRFKPSVDFLFSEVAALKGVRILAGIFTGMGKDGAEGMGKLKAVGAYNIAQDEKSCAVYGMPRAAVEAGATHRVLPLDEIAHAFLENSIKNRKAV